MYKVSETVLPIYINGQRPIIKTCSDVTLNLSSKDSKSVNILFYIYFSSKTYVVGTQKNRHNETKNGC